jgi:hypothetical protein
MGKHRKGKTRKGGKPAGHRARGWDRSAREVRLMIRMRRERDERREDW